MFMAFVQGIGFGFGLWLFFVLAVLVLRMPTKQSVANAKLTDQTLLALEARNVIGTRQAAMEGIGDRLDEIVGKLPYPSVK